MATRKEFCEAMERVYQNHGVYIGTANGVLTEKLIETIIKLETDYGYSKETTLKNIGRDLIYIGNCYLRGWNMTNSKAGDCSGIVVGEMRSLGLLKPYDDLNCKMFQKKSVPVPLNELQDADLVFDKASEATHMGVAIIDAKTGKTYIIESKGRDVGVIKRPLNETNFVIGGRLDWFSDDIPVLTRNLRYIKGNLMRGEDVRQCQAQLNKKGFDAGIEDGIFGIKTLDSVLAFQTVNDLTPDGVVGQITWGCLFS